MSSVPPRFEISLAELETVCVLALRQQIRDVRAVMIRAVRNRAVVGDWEVVAIVPCPSPLRLEIAMESVREIRKAFALRTTH